VSGPGGVLEVLRGVDLFEELSEDCLRRIAASAREERLAAGDWVVREGGRVEWFGVLTDGMVDWVKMVDGRELVMASRSAPTYFGAMNLLTEEPSPAGGRAVVECEVVVVPGDEFRRLLRDEPSVLRRSLRVIAPVHQGAEAVLREREKLAALGTLSAGLAHELNNPAAAAQRAAAQLAEAIDVVGAAVGHFVESGVERSEAETLVALQREALSGACDVSALDALDAADAEDELTERLEALGVSEPWRHAEPLAAAGVDAAWLERLAAAAGPATDAAVAWVAATLAARGLAAELQESTRRMSDLVGAVKSYAYMDRGGLVEVDLHEGLEMTLKVLGHKLKHTSIEVVREYDRSLPKLTVRGSELNQVWTNLLDNAIDALGDRGTITVTTRRDNARALVDVGDDGPGIPPEHRDRVFDSFFTTKDVGAGTGLGLATARRIVVDRHDGSLTFDSRPGRTTFHVSLPIRQETP
jgi:signal transduction histidine kinase